MDLQLIGNILIGVILLGWIAYRQTTWRPVSIGQMWRMPLVLGIVGVVMVVQSRAVVNGVDLAFLVIELIVSVGVGAWMGSLAHFRRLAEPRPVLSRSGVQTGVAEFETRTGWLGLALWLLMIALRVGLDVLAGHLGAHVVTSTGVILLMLAANRAARIALIGARVGRLAPVAASAA
jgi:hypothetical protein